MSESIEQDKNPTESRLLTNDTPKRRPTRYVPLGMGIWIDADLLRKKEAQAA
jgi:hypothetical protein